jgi:hypothetical protein
VLTFEEFMSIPPCTTGTHSTTDLPPAVEDKKQQTDESADALAAKIDALNAAAAAAPTRNPVVSSTPAAGDRPAPPAVDPETEDDDPALDIPEGKQCRRRTCGAAYAKNGAHAGTKCVHHPGAPIFHEGSKGYSCCKRRVLEFDQFMRIEGCATKERHLFVGSGKKKAATAAASADGEEIVESVR